MDVKPLLARFADQDRRALARLITLVESRSPEVPAIMREIYPRTGRATVVGITGPPGAGKSTLLHIAGLLERPDSGQVLINGIDCGQLSDNDQTRLRRM